MFKKFCTPFSLHQFTSLSASRGAFQLHLFPGRSSVLLSLISTPLSHIIMNRWQPLNNGNILNHVDRHGTGNDARHSMALTNRSRGHKGQVIHDNSKTLVIDPFYEVGSTCFVYRDVSQPHLQQIQTVHVHHLGSFKDLRLNLKTFPSLQTLVVHILPDAFIQNTNFGMMSDAKVYEFVTAYLFNHRRHRNFRDNLIKLHQNEGKPKTFSLKARLNGMDYLTFIIVDLDTLEVERGIRCLPTNFFRSPREQALRHALVPRIHTEEPYSRDYSNDALLEIASNWPYHEPKSVAHPMGPWHDAHYWRVYGHFRQKQRLEASRQRQLRMAVMDSQNGPEDSSMDNLGEDLSRVQL
jgi:hypothetical protein